MPRIFQSGDVTRDLEDVRLYVGQTDGGNQQVMSGVHPDIFITAKECTELLSRQSWGAITSQGALENNINAGVRNAISCKVVIGLMFQI